MIRPGPDAAGVTGHHQLTITSRFTLPVASRTLY